MANTTNFGWETPDDTDLVKDGAAAMRTLGNSIDASFVDLKGGTTGQVLTKASNTDLDFTFATPAASSPPSATAEVTTSEQTSSTTYTDLTTAGPAVTITTGTKALVIVGGQQEAGDPNTAFFSFAVSGATTLSANDKWAYQLRDNYTNNGSKAYLLTGLTAGSNTFTAKYKTSGGTSYFRNRNIIVINMGS